MDCCRGVAALHLDHAEPLHDAVGALEHEPGWKVPRSDGGGVPEVLGDVPPVRVEQLLERLQDADGHLNPLHPLLQLHLEQLLGNEVGKSLERDPEALSVASPPPVGVSLYLLDHQVAELLQEDDHALSRAVASGMAPDEAEGVEERRQGVGHFGETRLFQIADHSPQRAQMKIDVLGLQRR